MNASRFRGVPGQLVCISSIFLLELDDLIKAIDGAVNPGAAARMARDETTVVETSTASALAFAHLGIHKPFAGRWIPKVGSPSAGQGFSIADAGDMAILQSPVK